MYLYKITDDLFVYGAITNKKIEEIEIDEDNTWTFWWPGSEAYNNQGWIIERIPIGNILTQPFDDCEVELVNEVDLDLDQYIVSILNQYFAEHHFADLL